MKNVIKIIIAAMLLISVVTVLGCTGATNNITSSITPTPTIVSITPVPSIVATQSIGSKDAIVGAWMFPNDTSGATTTFNDNGTIFLTTAPFSNGLAMVTDTYNIGRWTWDGGSSYTMTDNNGKTAPLTLSENTIYCSGDLAFVHTSSITPAITATSEPTISSAHNITAIIATITPTPMLTNEIVTGTVTINGNPASNLKVDAFVLGHEYGQICSTDANGYYSITLPNVPYTEKNYSLIVWKDNVYGQALYNNTFPFDGQTLNINLISQ